MSIPQLPGTLNDLLSNANSQGMLQASLLPSNGSSAVPPDVAAGGYSGIGHFKSTPTLPSLGTGVNGMLLTAAFLRQFTSNNSGQMLGLEVLLGTVTVSGNVFVAGSSMPTRNVYGSSVQLAASAVFVVVSSTINASTPSTVTVTYTDQSGNTGKTASVQVQANAAIECAYLLTPYLASGSPGVRAVTGISVTANLSGGAYKVYGFCQLLWAGESGSQNTVGCLQPNEYSTPQVPLASGDTLACYGYANTGGGAMGRVAGAYGMVATS